MSKINLNNYKINVDWVGMGDGSWNDGYLKNYSVKTTNPQFDSVEVILRNIESRLLDIIKEFKNGAIFGSVAWMTSTPILKALSDCDNVQILVQKEDFLRPDIGQETNNNWKKYLRELYGNLRCNISRYECREPINMLNILSSGAEYLEAIRCVGGHNSDKSPAFPRAHNKFLVFCECREPDDDSNEPRYKPIALWTGSFNMTENAKHSLENVLYLVDKSGNNDIINAYLNEHHQIFALSEPLDWEKDWIEPEFRIGT